MADLGYAYCPSCTKEAKGEDNVDELFGFRNNSEYFMVQSHCRECRSRESSMRRKTKLVKQRKRKK